MNASSSRGAEAGPDREPRDRNLLLTTFAVYVLVVLRITQWPTLADDGVFDRLDLVLAWAHARGLPAGIDVPVVEAVANVVMFVPLGVLFPLVARRSPWLAVPAGAAFSSAIELSQLTFFPGRVATVQDVVMNTLGAAVGAAVLAAHRRRHASRLRGVTRSSEPRPSLLQPSTLEPVHLDLRRVFWTGTAVWAVALAVASVLVLTGHLQGRAVGVCATGVALGLMGVVWARFRGAAHS